MPGEVYQFCGNCYWYDVDDDHRASAWCVKHKEKTSCVDVFHQSCIWKDPSFDYDHQKEAKSFYPSSQQGRG